MLLRLVDDRLNAIDEVQSTGRHMIHPKLKLLNTVFVAAEGSGQNRVQGQRQARFPR